MSQSGPPRPSLSSELDGAFEHDEMAVAFLVGLSGKHAGKLFRVRQGESIIGRTSKALVTLDEKAVSHRHAMLTLTSTQCVLVDLESTNGTFVNDVKIIEPRELLAGDVIRFGNSTLGYLTDADDEGQHTRALARVTSPNLGVGAHSVAVGATQTSLPPMGGSGSDARHGLVHAPGGRAELATSHAAVIEVSQPAGPGGLDMALDYAAIGLKFIKSYRWLILGTILGFAAVGAGTMKLMPPKSTAEFEVMLRQDQIESTTHHFATRGIEYFASAEKNFTNSDIVGQTLKELDQPHDDRSVKLAEKGLEFAKIAPGMYRGSFKHPDSEFAETFLASHVRNYLQFEIGKSIRVLASEVNLLRKQYDENSASLRKYETELRDFKQENGDALPEAASDQMKSKYGLLERRDALEASLIRYQKELELARKQYASEDALLGSNVTRSAAYDTDLRTVERELATARSKGWAETHPQVMELTRQRESLEAQRDRALSTATTETDRRTNPEHKRLENRVAQLRIDVESTGAELGQVNSRLGKVDEVAGDMPSVEAEISRKLREVANSKSLNDRLYEQLKAKELELEFERASVEARYEIMVPPHAYPLNYTRSTLIRAVAGAVAGIIFGFIFAGIHWLYSYARNRQTGAPG